VASRIAPVVHSGGVVVVFGRGVKEDYTLSGCDDVRLTKGCISEMRSPPHAAAAAAAA